MINHSVGKVYLIGAGPGHKDLITIRGLELLRKAEVVIYDRLISEELLLVVSPLCKLICVGKNPNNHSVKQDEINEIICQHALQGKVVVRLKGGDPFVFGRASEEIQSLEKYHIPYEVVPGVTSAIGALAMAGIPVTNRQMATSFHVITGHRASGNLEAELPIYSKLPGTLVFLMGVATIKEIINGLLKNGMDANTPVAIVENGCTYKTRRINGSLKNIISIAEKENVVNPALIVVGVNAGLDFLCNYDNLSGCRVLTLGTEFFVNKLGQRISDNGGVVSRLPFVKITPSINWKNLLPIIENSKWLIFTSPNGVKSFFNELRKSSIDIRIILSHKFAVVGKGTYDALAEYGIWADFCPKCFTVKNLAIELLEAYPEIETSKLPLAILRSDIGSEDIINVFNAKDIKYQDVAIYNTNVCFEILEKLPELLKITDYLVVGSSFAAKALFKYVNDKKTMGKDENSIVGEDVCTRSIYHEFESLLKHGKIVCLGSSTNKTVMDLLRNNFGEQYCNRCITALTFDTNGIKDIIAEDYLENLHQCNIETKK